MLLSDAAIQLNLESGLIRINPYPEDVQFQPASVDLRLGKEFRTPDREHVFDVEEYVIGSGECILAHTLETVHVPNNLIARVEGRSSYGRRFLNIHCTAGFIDPGFHGQITLELVNHNSEPLKLVAGSRICQIVFETMLGECKRPYGSDGLRSKYQGQSGATLPLDDMTVTD